MLDIDLTAWDEYINTEITAENDELYTKDVFAEELVKVFAPFGKILDWLLVGEDEEIPEDILYNERSLDEGAEEPAEGADETDGEGKPEDPDDKAE